MPFEMLLSETTTEGVLILTLNDPATLNSVRGSMMEELASEIDRFESDRSLRTLIITGAGRSFCSGANLRGFAQDIAQSEAAAEAASNEPPIETSRLPWPELDPVYAHRETAHSPGSGHRTARSATSIAMGCWPIRGRSRMISGRRGLPFGPIWRWPSTRCQSRIPSFSWRYTEAKEKTARCSG